MVKNNISASEFSEQHPFATQNIKQIREEGGNYKNIFFGENSF